MERHEARPLGTILWRRKWIVIVTTTIALATSIAISVVRTPQYAASAVLVREQQSVDVALFGTAIYPYEDVQRELVTTAHAVTSLRVAQLVKQSTGSPHSATRLLGMVTASASTNSNTITVRAVGPNPQETAAVADAFANQTILTRRESDKAGIVTAREALAAQIALMSPADLASEQGKSLQTRVEQFKILEELQTGGYSLWQSAQVPQNPVSPRPIRDGAAGLAVGLVLGLVLAVANDRLDRRLKDHSDFEREFGLPILALVPRIGRRWKRDYENTSGFIGFADTRSPTAESYRLLRSNLQYFEVEKGLQSILITSGLPQESKTVTATNLALSLAISGAKVVLVDSDLRNPLMHRYLHLDNSVGLSSVLAGAVGVEEALKVVKTAEFVPQGVPPPKGSQTRLHRDFLCMTSGPLPPNPAELLASARLGDILKNLSGLAEYILIDSAPILLVADAVSVASRVDGVIIVAKAGRTTTDQARETRNTLERVGARLVGVVVSGVKAPSSYGYKKGYYQEGA
jgi:capsular exopolysaccharide synthesis family protein